MRPQTARPWDPWRGTTGEAGDFIFIEPGVPHEVFNLSATEPVVAVVARSDPSEWENIIPYQRGAHGLPGSGDGVTLTGVDAQDPTSGA